MEIAFGKEALCHISQLSDKRIPTVEDAVKVGDKLTVKITEIDDKGRINASHRALIEGDSPKSPTKNFDRPRSDDRPLRNFDRQRNDDKSSRNFDRQKNYDRPRSDKPRGESRAIKDLRDLKNSRDSRRRRDT